MKAFIYNVESNEVVVVINGENNEQCEAKATDLNFMGTDEYGLTYSDNGLFMTEHSDEVEA